MTTTNINHAANRPVVVASSAYTALGDINATWEGLMAGKSALSPVSFTGVSSRYPVGRIDGLTGDFGSLERLTCLVARGLADINIIGELTGCCDIIVATTKGAADELLASPDNPVGQPWDLGKLVAGIAGCPGPTQIISAACASGTVALIQAAKQIMAGVSEAVIVVGIDILSQFVVTGFDALKALSPAPCRPFDKKRNGLSLGEGVGAIVVASPLFAANNGLEILALLDGWGVSCDATHITAPSRDGSGLRRVLDLATENGRKPVGAIHAHGTGTRYNDAMEMTAFRHFWKQLPPIHSIKGAVGHCLGAAGVIEAAIGVRSLKHGCIPPTVGFQEEESGTGKVSGTSSLALAGPSILSCNSGFGGINAGILFFAPDNISINRKDGILRNLFP